MPELVRDRIPAGIEVRRKRDRTKPNRWVWKCRWCRRHRTRQQLSETPYVTGNADTVRELAESINAHVQTDQHQAYLEASLGGR
jgi:hypothetical protein